MFITIVAFLLILTILVLIHELGHFLTAKFFGIKVEEFGFGFPPRAWGKKIGETLYSVNWLPIGGFVKLYGEDEAGGGSLKNSDSLEKIKDTKRAFFARSITQRFLVVFAGVFMNFLLAGILLTYLVAALGIPTAGKQVLVVEVLKNTPAAQAGIQKGDQIATVDNIQITAPENLIAYTRSHEGKKIALTIFTNKKQQKTIVLIPRLHFPPNEGAMGIAIGTNVIVTHYPWYQAPFVGFQQAFGQSWMIIAGLWQLLVQLFVHRTIPQGLAGPVGIAQITGQFVAMGFNAVLSLLALLSLNLAVLNILPIPALDGGRLFFILIEGITRRKVSPKIEGYIHMVGMIFLLILIVLITFHDIMRIADGGSLLPK